MTFGQSDAPGDRAITLEDSDIARMLRGPKIGVNMVRASPQESFGFAIVEG